MGNDDGAAAVDAQLVDRARSGSQRAAELLYDRHVTTVRFVITDNVRNPDDIDDVVQEVFGRAFARLDDLDDPERFRAWLLQIARRAAIDARRARRRRPSCDSIEDRAFVDCGPTPDLVAEVRDLARAIGAGVDGLSRRDRMVLTMVVELGLSLDDVAGALDISYGNAKVVLHRARRRLRDAVDPVIDVGDTGRDLAVAV